jgi:hypothetical protein
MIATKILNILGLQIQTQIQNRVTSGLAVLKEFSEKTNWTQILIGDIVKFVGGDPT